ncbi:unnamed protein product, partial [Ectocarpus sp. 12 AP-2014]
MESPALRCASDVRPGVHGGGKGSCQAGENGYVNNNNLLFTGSLVRQQQQ